MSEISAIGNTVVGNVRPTSATTPTTVVEVAAPAVGCGTTTVDLVDFSEHAQMLEKVRQLPEVRQERIDSIKEAIANDTYLSDAKINTAFERLIDEVAG